MSWSEKITRYKEAQEQLAVQLAEQKEQLAIQKALPRYYEYLQEREKSLALLNKLGVKELLTQIRDEVWQRGEVVLIPPLPPPGEERLKGPWNFFPQDYEKKTNKSTAYALFIAFPYYISAYTSEDENHYGFYSPPTISANYEFLSVEVSPKVPRIGEETVDIRSTSSPIEKSHVVIPVSSPSLKNDLETALIEDCLNRSRDLPYITPSLESTNTDILDLVLQGNGVPYGCEYLIGFAQQYAEKKSQAVPEDSWDHLGAFFGRLYRDIRDSLR